ncbi:MAG: serine/threonine-protein kinase [Phycisphaerales bacterium]|nr:serine/threonine-protein kinase [Phycisphaerales bacterium]
MNPDPSSSQPLPKHERVKEIFLAAANLPPADREPFIRLQTDGDEATRARVLQLLKAMDGPGAFLKEPTALQPDHGESPTLAHPSALGSPPTEVHIAEDVGSHVGHYKLLQLIGEGGFGRVFMAEQEQPVRRKVAFKIIKLGMDTRQVVARFEQERQALALMDHPHIAKVLDAGSTTTGRPFFVMELCAGEPITKYCDDHRLRIRDRLSLFVQVCKAVQHAHQKGVIHRDIKPSNVLVATHDGRAHAKVIDFGIAKAVDRNLTERTLFTEHKQLIGTPEYMSPEQAEGSLDIDTRTDVYSLGVLLYELLTGSTPFDSATLRSAALGEIQRIIREIDPPTPSTRVALSAETVRNVATLRQSDARGLSTIIRGELDWIVMCALDKDRARRYDSPSALAQDIERHLAGSPIAAAPPSTAYRVRKFVRRHRAPVIAGTLIAAALVFGAIGTTLGFINASRQRDQANIAKDEATSARDEAEAVTTFLTSVLSSADPNAMGKDVTVRAVIDKASRTIDPSIQARPRVESRVREAIGRTYLALGEYGEGETNIARSLELARSAFGPNSVHTIRTDELAGQVLFRTGKYPEAIAHLKRVIADADAQLGTKHDVSLTARNTLAYVYAQAAQTEDAIALTREVIDGFTASKGPDDENILSAKGTLAVLLSDLQKYDEAEILYAEVDAALHKKFGPDHPTTLSNRSNRAWALQQQGKHDQCVEIFASVLASRKRVLGPDHPETLQVENNLANSLRGLKRYEEAGVLYERVFEVARSRDGAEHPETLISMANLARFYQETDQFERAEPMFQECEALYRKVLGTKHPHAVMTVLGHGICLRRMNKLDEAVAKLTNAHTLLTKLRPPIPSATRRAAQEIALAFEAQGKSDDAEKWRAEAEKLKPKP